MARFFRNPEQVGSCIYALMSADVDSLVPLEYEFR